MKLYRSFKPILAIALTAAVFLAALYATKIVHLSRGSFFPSSLVTHSLMLILSVAAMGLISKGRLNLYGFTWGTYTFSSRILLWVLPTAVLSIGSAIASRGAMGTGLTFGFTKVQGNIFIWIYASICEETLVRGLLQTLLSRSANVGAAASRWLSMPVLMSGIFFGTMHLVLVKQMGLGAIPVILLATCLGFVVAHYREKTGSLLPAILIHMLFNIGGTLPLWVIQWLRGGQ